MIFLQIYLSGETKPTSIFRSLIEYIRASPSGRKHRAGFLDPASTQGERNEVAR
jgi:hypothetical protein